MTTTGVVRGLFHYPVKGLSAQPLDEVELHPGRGVPFDRVYGLARHDSGFDPAAPRPMPKDRFLMLMRDERLAGLATHLDPLTSELTIAVQGHDVLSADLAAEDGRADVNRFFARMFDLDDDHSPRIVCAEPHRFTDVSVVSPPLMNAISVLNLASVADLGARIGRTVHPARFRANVWIDGWPPFSELDLVGREITIGAARARVTLRTRRCAATEVDPERARRDVPVPRALVEHYGHADMGVYVEVDRAGRVRPGDAATTPGR